MNGTRKQRTLLIAHGLEMDRLLAALYLHAPSRMVIIRSHEDASEGLTEQVDRVTSEFRDFLNSDFGRKVYPFLDPTQIVERRVDFFSVPRAFAEISEIVREEFRARREVQIDVSSGNKIAAISLFLVGQQFNLFTTYSTPWGYKVDNLPSNSKGLSERLEDVQAVVAHLIRDYVVIPRLPMRIESVDFVVLEAINEAGPEGTSLTGLAQTLSGTDWRTKPRKADLVRLSRVCDSLLEWGYVDRFRRGREIRLVATSNGRDVLPMAPKSVTEVAEDAAGANQRARGLPKVAAQ